MSAYPGQSQSTGGWRGESKEGAKGRGDLESPFKGGGHHLA